MTLFDNLNQIECSNLPGPKLLVQKFLVSRKVCQQLGTRFYDEDTLQSEFLGIGNEIFNGPDF